MALNYAYNPSVGYALHTDGGGSSGGSRSGSSSSKPPSTPGQFVTFTPDPTVGGAWTHTRADVPLFKSAAPAPASFGGGMSSQSKALDDLTSIFKSKKQSGLTDWQSKYGGLFKPAPAPTGPIIHDPGAPDVPAPGSAPPGPAPKSIYDLYRDLSGSRTPSVGSDEWRAKLAAALSGGIL